MPTSKSRGPSKRQQQALNIYGALMQEIKLRLSGIEFALKDKTGLAESLVSEFCFLQLRMICELIALGCLTAHGDITEANKLRKEYSASRIMIALSELHTGFYPIPSNQIQMGDNHFRLKNITSGFLTKDELIQLSGRCGAILHRGNVKNLLTPDRQNLAGNGRLIAGNCQKITKLLSCHRLLLFDGASHFVCIMAPNGGEQVQVVFGQS